MSPHPDEFQPFKFHPPSPAESSETTPRQLLVAPLTAPFPAAEPSFSITPYGSDPPHILSVRSALPSSATPFSPFDVCETPKQGARPFAFPTQDTEPQATLQPPDAPCRERSSLGLLRSARTGSPASQGPESGGLLAKPLAECFPDSAAEGSVGGWQTEESPEEEVVEPSVCNSFHAAEELAGQMATMQVCHPMLACLLS